MQCLQLTPPLTTLSQHALLLGRDYIVDSGQKTLALTILQAHSFTYFRFLFKYLLIRKVFLTTPLKKKSPPSLFYFLSNNSVTIPFAFCNLLSLPLDCKPNESWAFIVSIALHIHAWHIAVKNIHRLNEWMNNWLNEWTNESIQSAMSLKLNVDNFTCLKTFPYFLLAWDSYISALI